MRVLVTGATGFVGSWLVRGLLDQGLDVRILRRQSSPPSTLFDESRVEVSYGDITDFQSVARAAQGCHTLFHLAGLVGYSRAQRPMMELVNVEGTINAVNAAVKNRVHRFVHMSSVVAVGASFDGTHPLNEDSPYNLSHLNLGYFETKRKAETIVLDAVSNGSLDAVVLNPSTIYGPGDALKGSRGAQLKVAQHKMPFYTSGGVSIIHVEEVVAATLSAWQRGRSGQRYILSGDNILIKDLFQMIARTAGVSAPSVRLPNKIVHLVGSIGDALENLGKKGPLNSETAWTSTMFHWYRSDRARRELGLVTRPALSSIEESVLWMRENGLIH